MLAPTAALVAISIALGLLPSFGRYALSASNELQNCEMYTARVLEGQTTSIEVPEVSVTHRGSPGGSRCAAVLIAAFARFGFDHTYSELSALGKFGEANRDLSRG